MFSVVLRALALLLVLSHVARAQALPADDLPTQYARRITPEVLRRHLTELASDAYQGRETGEQGGRLAADYLAVQFQKLGLSAPVPGRDNLYRLYDPCLDDPLPNEPVQRFWVERSVWDAGHMKLQIGAQSFHWLEDFYASGDSPFFQETTVQPVFVGYGIEQAGYSDYASLDVRGKDLIALLGEPLDITGKPRFGAPGKPSRWSINSRAKLSVAAAKGARSIFFIYPDQADFTAALIRFKPYIVKGRMTLPTAEAQTEATTTASFLVSPAVGCALLGTTAAGLQAYQQAASTVTGPVAASFRVAALRIRAPRVQQRVPTENVLGYLEGTDRKEEVLVVSAHYDHLGTWEGQVYNGADDNGSGTAALLTIAQAFVQASKDGHGPRRSVLFLAFTGEEKGLLGSEYYTEHPVFPLASTIADLNIDMIGRTDDQHRPDQPYLDVVGSNKRSAELHAISEAANEQYTKLALDYRYNAPDDPEQVYYRSDHYHFAKHGIPVIFYTTGDHADYHQPTDDLTKIEFPLLARRTQLIFYTAWELANRDQRIAVKLVNKP
ncbi:M28 family peptidase [Hymenobacter crusticola]|uniref:Peptidase M28 domain-containing protein n=1 Tax=Hymenobacter crusticola TaxID=1770526 RepID=A0A243WG24_9BACT|nr:M28 family peptidase [Hymenobacter crusticola]OUJ74680.1 hypothetical protein BXP70_07905 [Hymenobacter crusticola]